MNQSCKRLLFHFRFSWHPVSEKPPKNGNYLVYISEEWLRRGMDISHFDGVDWWSEFGYKKWTKNVTHWCELPPTPDQLAESLLNSRIIDWENYA